MLQLQHQFFLQGQTTEEVGSNRPKRSVIGTKNLIRDLTKNETQIVFLAQVVDKANRIAQFRLKGKW